MSEKSNKPHAAKSLIEVSTSPPPAPASRGGPRRREESQANITVGFVLGALRQWWKVATPIGLALAAMAAAMVYFTFEPVYEASTAIEIISKQPFLAFASRDDSNRFVDNQQALLRSRQVLGPVVSSKDVSGLIEVKELGDRDPIEWIARRLKVTQLGRSEYFQVSFTGPSANGAAAIVNEVRDVYFRLRLEVDNNRVQRVVKLLEDEKENRLKEVETLRKVVKQLTMDATGKNPFLDTSATETKSDYLLSNLRSRLTSAEVDREVMEAQFRAIYEEWLVLQPAGEVGGAAPEDTAAEPDKPEHGTSAEDAPADAEGETDVLPFDPPGVLVQSADGEISPVGWKPVDLPQGVVDEAIAADPEVQRQTVMIEARKSNLTATEAAALAGKEDAAYKNLEESIGEDQTRLDEYRDTLRKKLEKKLKHLELTRRQDVLAAMNAELRSNRIMERMLRERYESERGNSETFAGETFDLQVKRDDMTRAQKVHDRIAMRMVELADKQRAPERVKPWGPAAKPPKYPVQSDPYKTMTLASLAGFFAPFVLAVFWERVLRRVSDRKHLEQQSDLPCVGEIARLPRRRSAAGRLSSSGSSAVDFGIFEESVDSLRTSLFLSDALRDVRILAVTSAANHEGKTSVAAQLAVSIARSCGEPTLLIDGDMRSPDVHRMFEIPLEPGLAEVLDHQCTLVDAIVTSWSDYVHVIPAGKLQKNPHKLLGNGVMKSLLDEIPASYRYVVIDTPPILAASEALILAKAADASLLCAMRDVSRMDQVTRARERLAAAGARPVGTVLSGIPSRRYVYRYGKYSYAQ